MPVKEFPETKTGLTPRGYSVGRIAGKCVWIVIHTTDGSGTARSAEDGNSYDARRTDSVSTHVFIDSDSVVQEINTWDRAWAARELANNIGYQVELCTVASTTFAMWHNTYHAAMLLRAEQHCARVALKLGIPGKWVTRDEAVHAKPGFLTHNDVTQWISGTHTDPGAGFPRTEFINGVAHWMNVYSSKPTPKPLPRRPVEMDRTMVLMQVEGDSAIWKTDGQNAWHISTMQEVTSLVALFGPVKKVPTWPRSIKSISDTPAALNRMAPMDEGIDNEHG